MYWDGSKWLSLSKMIALWFLENWLGTLIFHAFTLTICGRLWRNKHFWVMRYIEIPFDLHLFLIKLFKDLHFIKRKIEWQNRIFLKIHFLLNYFHKLYFGKIVWRYCYIHSKAFFPCLIQRRFICAVVLRNSGELRPNKLF